MITDPIAPLVQECRDTDDCCPGGPSACRLDAARAVVGFKQKPVSLRYAWSDGQTFSEVDQPGGIPDRARERALLRALLTHALSQLDQYDPSVSIASA
ncbi:hypothetical protein AB0M57_04685 [Streptomyces sp. NPDC051597]|uniref:hypothetical protein n=1 Tax=Streptomyces sp. NPDC051597 TaxID=3155049 RepID=UPI003435AA1A